MRKSREYYLFMLRYIIAVSLFLALSFSLFITLEELTYNSGHRCIKVHTFSCVVLFSHILTFNMDTGYIFEQEMHVPEVRAAV